jgi:hypothetical protein
MDQPEQQDFKVLQALLDLMVLREQQGFRVLQVLLDLMVQPEHLD